MDHARITRFREGITGPTITGRTVITTGVIITTTGTILTTTNTITTDRTTRSLNKKISHTSIQRIEIKKINKNRGTL